MSYVSSMGVGFILVCVYLLPWISRIMIPSSHLHRPHGTSLSTKPSANRQLWVTQTSPAGPPFTCVLQVLFLSTGTGSRQATRSEWFLRISFWCVRSSPTANRTLEVFQTSACTRNAGGSYPRLPPRVRLSPAFFKSSSYILLQVSRLPAPAPVIA